MTLHLSPAANDGRIRCTSCGRMAADVPLGVPEGWDAAFSGGQWVTLCPPCRAPLDAPVFAVLRPLDGEIALFVGVGRELRTCALGMAEARQLHHTLGQALALAANPGGLAA